MFLIGVVDLVFVIIVFCMFSDFRKKARDPYLNQIQGFIRIYDPVLSVVSDEPLYAINSG